jgi:hypothetical protein
MILDHLCEEKEHKGHDGYTKDTMGCFFSLCPLCIRRVLRAPFSSHIKTWPGLKNSIFSFTPAALFLHRF